MTRCLASGRSASNLDPCQVCPSDLAVPKGQLPTLPEPEETPENAQCSGENQVQPLRQSKRKASRATKASRRRCGEPVGVVRELGAEPASRSHVMLCWELPCCHRALGFLRISKQLLPKRDNDVRGTRITSQEGCENVGPEQPVVESPFGPVRRLLSLTHLPFLQKGLLFLGLL